jgi:hypothetical protein
MRKTSLASFSKTNPFLQSSKPFKGFQRDSKPFKGAGEKIISSLGGLGVFACHVSRGSTWWLKGSLNTIAFPPVSSDDVDALLIYVT